MNDKELILKMNILGGLLRQMEEEKAAFEEKTKTLSELIESEKEELKAEFLERQKSMESEQLIVKYRKGAVRWDSAGLKIYAKDHPEMEQFQKVGEPTVAFILRKEEDPS